MVKDVFAVRLFLMNFVLTKFVICCQSPKFIPEKILCLQNEMEGVQNLKIEN